MGGYKVGNFYSWAALRFLEQRLNKGPGITFRRGLVRGSQAKA